MMPHAPSDGDWNLCFRAGGSGVQQFIVAVFGFCLKGKNRVFALQKVLRSYSMHPNEKIEKKQGI